MKYLLASKTPTFIKGFSLLSMLLVLGCSKGDKLAYRFDAEVQPADAGTITPGNADYVNGQTIEIRAIPNDGYVFLNWSGSISGETNPQTVVITDNFSVRAHFELADRDADGVLNEQDQCPETPDGATVNASGCKLTYVPDDWFEQRLIDLGYDDVLDDYVLSSNIEAITMLDLSWNNIKNYEGLRDFTSLKVLNVSKDSGSRELDVRGMASLEAIYSGMYGPSQIILEGNTSLKTIVCDNNDDVILPDFTQAPALEYVNFKNTDAYGIMDLSGNTKLSKLIMHNSGISGLNVRNGNNLNLELGLIMVSLSCVTVDDAAYSTANWTENIDEHIIFSEDCVY